MPNITTTKNPTAKTPHNETHLKKAIYKALIPFDCYHRKLSNPFRAGVLDLFVCYQGRCVWIENKILPNQLTPLQKNEISEIKRAGGLAYGIFAESDFSAFFLYRDDFDIIEYGNLTTLLKDILINEPNKEVKNE